MTDAPNLPAPPEARCPNISNAVAVDVEVAAAIERVRAYTWGMSTEFVADVDKVCAAASRAVGPSREPTQAMIEAGDNNANGAPEHIWRAMYDRWLCQAAIDSGAPIVGDAAEAANVAMSSVREALQELVACKDLHKAHAKAFATAIKSHADADYAELSRIETEMARREQPAWATARAVLADVSHLAAESQAAGSSKPIAVEVESPSAAQAQGAEPVLFCPHCNPCTHRSIIACRSPASTPWADDGVDWPFHEAGPPKEVAQEPPAPPGAKLAEHDRKILADLDAIVADKREDFWPVALALATARMIRQRDAALEAQRGEIAQWQNVTAHPTPESCRSGIAVMYGKWQTAEADTRASRDDAIKGWSNYRTADQQTQALRKELAAARDLAAQLWAVVRAADAMRDLVPVGKRFPVPLSILGPDARIARRYDDERTALPKDPHG